jgi:hypothetical protein
MEVVKCILEVILIMSKVDKITELIADYHQTDILSNGIEKEFK